MHERRSTLVYWGLVPFAAFLLALLAGPRPAGAVRPEPAPEARIVRIEALEESRGNDQRLWGNESNVTCETVAMPRLKAVFHRYRSSRVCYPVSWDGATFPLHVLAHGHGGGGPLLGSYESLQRQLASFGLVVAAYASCAFDSECDDGATSFLEVAKVVQYFEARPPASAVPVDLARPCSLSGHSTGGRVALMVAAVVDNPAYLAGTKFGALLTPDVRASLGKIKAVVGDHPDLMTKSYAPDQGQFNVTSMAVMVVTGSKDYIEPRLSGWTDFLMLQTPNKVYLDIVNATHMFAESPIDGHPEGPWMAYFVQYFALGMRTVGWRIYGNQTGSLVNAGITPTHERNSGGAGGNIGFLACRKKEVGGGLEAMPAQFVKYC